MLKNVVNMLFGASYKTSLFGMVGAMVAAGALYASGRTEPGFYLLALGLAAVGRLAADAAKPPAQ